MTPRAPRTDPYRRRREAGAASREETQRRLLVAADELFARQGYAETTVSAIAERAGVSLQTLYLAWGSKRALLLAAGDRAAVAADLPVSQEQWRATVRDVLARDAGTDPDAAAYLSAVAGLWAEVAERSAPYWRMNRQAAASDPEVEAARLTLDAERRRTLREVAAAVPRRGLATGLTTDDVAETLWALASPELHDVVVTQGGRSVEHYRAWLTRTLLASLCADGVPVTPSPQPAHHPRQEATS